MPWRTPMSELDDELTELLKKAPQPYLRGSVISPPRMEDVKKHNAKVARIKQAIKMKELMENPPKPRNPRVPISTRVQTVPGQPVHVFSTPVDGEASDISIMVGVGDFQEKAILELIMTSGGHTQIEKKVIKQNELISLPSIQMKATDEFLVQSEFVISLKMTMMFREA